MITGVHARGYTKDADKDRSFFRDVLGFKGFVAGQGWLTRGSKMGMYQPRHPTALSA